MRHSTSLRLTQGVSTLLDEALGLVDVPDGNDLLTFDDIAHIVRELGDAPLSRVRMLVPPQLLAPGQFHPARSHGQQIGDTMENEIYLLRSTLYNQACAACRRTGGQGQFSEDYKSVVTALSIGLGTNEERQRWYDCLPDAGKEVVDRLYPPNSTQEDKGYLAGRWRRVHFYLLWFTSGIRLSRHNLLACAGSSTAGPSTLQRPGLSTAPGGGEICRVECYRYRQVLSLSHIGSYHM